MPFRFRGKRCVVKTQRGCFHRVARVNWRSLGLSSFCQDERVPVGKKKQRSLRCSTIIEVLVRQVHGDPLVTRAFDLAHFSRTIYSFPWSA